MVGKPNFPADVDDRTDVKGAASPTPGLPAALDQEREASMADEGGASGAVMEGEEHVREALAIADLDDDPEEGFRLDPRALLIGAAAIAVIGYLAFGRRT